LISFRRIHKECEAMTRAIIGLAELDSIQLRKDRG
jgi:hypothetical protein